jgi:hypothetical protein
LNIPLEKWPKSRIGVSENYLLRKVAIILEIKTDKEVSQQIIGNASS